MDDQIKSKIIIASVLVVIGFFLFLGIYFFVLPDEERCLDVNCDDDNPCTIDECSTRSGVCYNTKKTCQENQKCNINTGNCEVIQEEDIMDQIEQEISEELGSGSEEEDEQFASETTSTESSGDAMNQIENAIEDALSGA